MKRTGLSLLVLILVSASLPVQQNDPFQGITDEKVLPMLKHLPYRHGGMNVPAEDGRLLYDIILDKGYKKGLEIGTSNGYSALWLGMAFKKTGGSLITLEIEPQRAREAMENFERSFLQHALREFNGARSELAKRLGISRKNLWQKLKKHGLDVSDES